jgi:homoserine dehydrogenase
MLDPASGRAQAHGAHRWRLGLVGLGNVGQGVLRILRESRTAISQRYGADLVVTAVAELGGGAVDPHGLDLDALLTELPAGRPVAGLPRVGRPGLTGRDLVESATPDILLEATPVNLRDAEPALTTVTRALELGVHVVLANKAPLALAYRKLRPMGHLTHERCLAVGAREPGAQLRFSACVGGALPVVNVGLRDLAASRITRFEGVLNGTSQSILRAIEAGLDYQTALADAQRRGIAEADPSLDVGGGDAACKLVIVANAVLGADVTVSDVRIRGIEGMSPSDVRAAALEGRRIVPLCTAEPTPQGCRLSVEPSPLDLDHPLARLSADEMGAVFYTATVDRLTLVSLEPGALPASAAMLRDVLDITERTRPLRRHSEA